MDNDNIQREEDLQFYAQIWRERKHYCFETGVFLGHESRKYMFHHVLEKEFYPEYRHLDENIVLVSLTAHDQVGLDIDKCPKIKEYRAQLLISLNSNQT